MITAHPRLLSTAEKNPSAAPKSALTTGRRRKNASPCAIEQFRTANAFSAMTRSGRPRTSTFASAERPAASVAARAGGRSPGEASAPFTARTVMNAEMNEARSAVRAENS